MLVENVLPGVLVRGSVTAKMTTKIRMDQKGQFSGQILDTRRSSDPPLPFSSSGGWLMDFGALGNDPVHVVLTLNQGQTVQWWLVDTYLWESSESRGYIILLPKKILLKQNQRNRKKI